MNNNNTADENMKMFMDNLIENSLLVISSAAKTNIGDWGVPDFENEVFKIAPYSWANNDIENEEEEYFEGFLYKPTGWHCDWYKHIGRGMVYDPITREEFMVMFSKCIQSLVN